MNYTKQKVFNMRSKIGFLIFYCGFSQISIGMEIPQSSENSDQIIYNNTHEETAEKKRIIGEKLLEQKNNICSTVYFVLEKVTPQNAKSWLEFGDQRGAIAEFNRKIDTHSSNEIWVAYAAAKNPNAEDFRMMQRHESPGNPYIQSDIEMVFCVNIKESYPITTHMGIFRTMWSRHPKFGGLLAHKNLSIHLHAFAAKAEMLLSPDVKVMVTIPTSNMGKILVDNLQHAPDQLFIGSQSERAQENIYRDTFIRDDTFIPPFAEPSVLSDAALPDWKITIPGMTEINCSCPSWYIGELGPTFIMPLEPLAARW